VNEIEEALFELLVSYAKRALLGGSKGQYVMEGVKRHNIELYHSLMRRAKDELNQADVSRDGQSKRP